MQKVKEIEKLSFTPLILPYLLPSFFTYLFIYLLTDWLTYFFSRFFFYCNFLSFFRTTPSLPLSTLILHSSHLKNISCNFLFFDLFITAFLSFYKLFLSKEWIYLCTSLSTSLLVLAQLFSYFEFIFFFFMCYLHHLLMYTLS